MGLSCLIDPTALIAVDASTVINLNATGCAADILRSIPNPVIIIDVVQDELREDSRSGRNDGDMVAALISACVLSVAKLDDLKESHFEELVIGRGDETLDDGEAATIAFGIERGAVVIVDERKATRLCGERFPKLAVGSSLDIFTHDAVLLALGEKALSDAVFNALHSARMRVPPSALSWVIELLGQERASLCESLPRSARAVPENRH
jgi:predicted nucleic acid-binding protein